MKYSIEVEKQARALMELIAELREINSEDNIAVDNVGNEVNSTFDVSAYIDNLD